MIFEVSERRKGEIGGEENSDAADVASSEVMESILVEGLQVPPLWYQRNTYRYYLRSEIVPCMCLAFLAALRDWHRQNHHLGSAR
jgi:hypothetical protein